MIEIVKWLTNLIVLLVSLGYTIRHFKITRTISYIERFNSASMIEIRAAVEHWAKLPLDEKLKKLSDDPETDYKVTLIYNIITEIAISYKYRIINRKITRQIFDPLIPDYFEKLKPYIQYRRSKGQNVGNFFEMVHYEILKRRDKNPGKF